jgi:translation initiation factor 6 (eIF-6)
VKGTIVTERSRNVVVAPTAEDLKKKRLNDLFKAGKAKGLYGGKQEMAEYVSDVLQIAVEADDIASLSDGSLAIVEAAVASSGHFAEAS